MKRVIIFSFIMHNTFGKTYIWRQVYVQTSSNFYKIRAHTFLYKSVKVHTLTAIFKTALKTWILQLQHLRKVKMCFYLILFHCFLPLDYVSRYSIYFMLFKSELNKKDLLGLTKRRSKVHQQNTPYKRAFNFNQWKPFYKNLCSRGFLTLKRGILPPLRK